MVKVRRRCQHPMAVGLGLWCVLTAAVATSSSAAIVAAAGDVAQIPPPPSVVPQALESDFHIHAFDEAQHLELPTAIRVDISSPGTYEKWPDLTPAVIAAGAEVSSYLLHADQMDFCRSVALEGSITFDTDILGVILRKHTLNKTDGILGALDTEYPTNRLGLSRGAELLSSQDSVVLEPDGRTLTVHLAVGSAIDQIRVVTDAPEPTALSLLALGVLPAIRSRRR